MLSRDSEDKMWSRFVIWPQEVTWTQPSGPLCLWQCFLSKSQHFGTLQHIVLVGISLTFLQNHGVKGEKFPKIEEVQRLWRKGPKEWEAVKKEIWKENLGIRKLWPKSLESEMISKRSIGRNQKQEPFWQEGWRPTRKKNYKYWVTEKTKGQKEKGFYQNTIRHCNCRHPFFQFDFNTFKKVFFCGNNSSDAFLYLITFKEMSLDKCVYRISYTLLTFQIICLSAPFSWNAAIYNP